MNDWTTTPTGGLRLRIDRGEEYIEAMIHQGGDNLWTAHVCLYRRGRFKWNSKTKRCRSSVLNYGYLDARPKTQREALAWANEQIRLLAAGVKPTHTP